MSDSDQAIASIKAVLDKRDAEISSLRKEAMTARSETLRVGALIGQLRSHLLTCDFPPTECAILKMCWDAIDNGEQLIDIVVRMNADRGLRRELC